MTQASSLRASPQPTCCPSALARRTVRVEFGGAPAGQALDDRAHVVHVLHVVRVERGDEQAAAGGVQQHALSAQQQQRLLHRLARHAQRLRHLFLDHPVARGECTFGDVLEDRVAHLFDQVGLYGQGLHRECRSA